MIKKISGEVLIKNKLGLHARASTKLIQLANTFHCKVIIKSPEGEADATSIMELLMLAAIQDTKVKIIVEGEDEEENKSALEQIIHLFENKFGEI